MSNFFISLFKLLLCTTCDRALMEVQIMRSCITQVCDLV